MSEHSGRVRRVTHAQLEQLFERLLQNRGIALGFNKTVKAREDSRRLWESITLQLNSHGDGAVKDWKGWNKYWIDYKAKLKKAVAATRISQHGTGGGPSSIKPLTDIEKKFLSILGENFGQGLPGVRELQEMNAQQINDPSESQPGPSGLQDLIVDPPCSPPPPPVSSPGADDVIQEEDEQEMMPPPQTPRLTPRESPLRRQRRQRLRRSTVSAEDARRSMIQIAERRTNIENERNDILRELTGAILSLIRENNSLMRARYINEPSE